MFGWTYETFINLECLDKVLIVVLILSLLCKGIGEIICWIVCKSYNRDKTYKKPCIYLASGKIHECKLPKCKSKYFTSERCNKKKCPGYRTSNYSIEQIKTVRKWPFIILTICKWISELSTVLLIFRTLLNSTLSK